MTRAPGRYDGLTVKQADLLSFIRSEAAEIRTPSFEEMKDALGLSSKSGVHRLLTSLEQRGFITRLPGYARNVVAVDNPVPPGPRERPAIEIAVGSMSTDHLIGELRRRGFQFVGANL